MLKPGAAARGNHHRDALRRASSRHDDDLKYLPTRLSLVARLFATSRPPDVLLIQTSTPRNGNVSLGIEVNELPAAIEEVRRRGGVVVAQLNTHMSYNFSGAEIVIDDVEMTIEVEAALPSPDERPLDNDVRVIGENLSALSSDGATLQEGMGQLPDAASSRCTLDGILASGSRG